MPNDNMFDEEVEDTSPEEVPETAPAPAPAITAADVQRLIQDSTASLREDNEDLASELAEMRAARAVAPAPVDTPEVKQTTDEFIEDFTNDAPGTIERAASKIVDDRIAQMMPHLRQQNDTLHANLIEAEKQAVESEYGEGAWDKHFKRVIDNRMANIRQTNASALADPNVINTEVMGIHGLKRNELQALKNANIVAAEKAQKDADSRLLGRMQLGGMTGGNNAPPPTIDAPMDEAERAFVASKELAGMSVDIKQLRRVRANQSASYDDYVPASEAK